MLRGSVSVGVDYNSDVDQVKEILLDIADSHPHLMKNPTPNVIFKNFGDNSLDFQLIFMTAWAIVVPETRLYEKWFKDLPIRSF